MGVLDRLQAFVEASNSTNSNSDKLEVIRQFSEDAEVMKALRYVYSPYKQYYVTSANCQKRSDLVQYGYSDIFTLLDDLATRIITGHLAISHVNGFVEANKQHEDLIWNIIDRNIKTRSTTATINAVVPGLIPTFDVALAKAYDEKTQKKVKWQDGWYVSRKLDGVRCVCVIDETGAIEFFSRQGKQFDTLDNLRKEIEGWGLSNTVLDGEVCMVDENGDEDFTGIIKEIKRKDHTIEKPKFLVFDMLDLADFEAKSSESTFEYRYIWMQHFFEHHDYKLVEPVYQEKIESDSHLQEWVKKSADQNWEGLMLRKDTGYKGKRSDDILKVKKFFDDEYTVLAMETGTFRVIVDGREVEEEMLRHIIIEHKGYRVDVGSGFSIEQRRQFRDQPELIVGKTVTIQYFEESKNQDGGLSLRFPTIKAIYEHERQF